jgi:hypothetical protein
MAIERTAQGDQIVLDGFERSHKQALAARAVRRLKPTKPQAASPGPLFEEHPEPHPDLFQPGFAVSGHTQRGSLLTSP